MQSAEESEGVPGLMELVEQISALFPEWFDAVETDMVNHKQHQATQEIYHERMEKLEMSNAPAGRRFAVITSWGRDQLSIAENHLMNGEIYAAKTIQLDPLVHAAIRAVENSPEGVPLLADLREGVEAASEQIERTEKLIEQYGTMLEVAREHTRVSRIWEKVAQAYEQAEKVIDEANDLVMVWHERLSRMDRLADGESAA